MAYSVLIFSAGVEPVTEQSVLSFIASGPGDVGVVCLDQQILTGNEVGAGKGHLLLTGIGNRVGGEDQSDLAALNRSLTLRGRSFLEDHLVAFEAKLLSDVPRDVDVEAFVVLADLLTKARLVVLDADGEGVTGRASGAATTTRSHGDRQGRSRQHDEDLLADMHCSPYVATPVGLPEVLPMIGHAFISETMIDPDEVQQSCIA